MRGLDCLGRALLTVALILPARAVPAQEITFNPETYQCDGAATVYATYFDTALRRYVVLGFDGQQIALEAAAHDPRDLRYESPDPRDSHVWWLSGDRAMLLHGTGDDEALIYGECLPMD
ncbi:MliC family protein [Gemmobacter serpentinus]|uniref:MliC family protein n=1 Tax=Gemmobacter serpentinus TaxID=2652247 RepID=UPI00124BD270|nr:MliC family protein [Gemmobacter serpentinus]